MTEKIWKVLKPTLIIALIIYLLYIFVYLEFLQRKGATDFCKEQCTYYPEQKEWGIDLGWFFDEGEVESRIPTKKYFGEKDLDECINYCKYDLQREYKYLTQ